MAKDTWLNEKEIGDQLEKKGLLANYLVLLPDAVFLREQPVFRNYRPDFLAVESILDDCLEGTGKDMSCIATPIEIKITATLDSVLQVANYYWILNRFDSYEFQFGKYRNAEFTAGKPVLIARYFDQKVVEVADLVGCSCYRIITEGPTITALEHLAPDRCAFGRFAVEAHGSGNYKKFLRAIAGKILKQAGVL
jgi:hypothetical protein